MIFEVKIYVNLILKKY